MTLAAIAKTLAKELSTSDRNVEQVMRLLDEGLKAPTIAHYRRAEIGELTEGAIRRIERRRRQLEELDRRRRSLLRSVAKEIRAAHRADAEAARAQAEAGQADAGLADAGLADAGLADAGLADAGLADAGLADAGLATADGGTTEADAVAPEAPSNVRDEADAPVAAATLATDAPAADASAEDGAEAGASDEETSAAQVSASEPAVPQDPVEEFAEVAPALVRAAFRCSERSELEDLFLPLRRPEPEVQLALDRGLGALADQLVEPGPKQVGGDDGDPSDGEASDAAGGEAPSVTDAAGTDQSASAPAQPESPASESPASESQEAEGASAAAESEGPSTETDDAETPAASGAAEDAASAAGTASDAAEAPPTEAAAPTQAETPPRQVAFTPGLARLCAPYVQPGRGVHTEEEALEGAMRILSDRLGRDPKVRGALRKLVRKHGKLQVRALVDEKQLGRNRSLLKLRVPVRQLQGHKLIALRQALMRRQVSVHVDLDPQLALPKLVATLGSRLPEERQQVAEVVAERALQRRLLPMIEEDLRAEIRERAEEEAIRSIAQNLRQTLLAPPGGYRSAGGVYIDAKGDWTIVPLGPDGQPLAEAVKVEAGSLEPPQLADPLRAALSEHGVRVLAVSSEKSAKAGVRKLRETVHLLGAQAAVVPVNDAGLSNWANGESARSEFGELPVPVRTAIGLARRWQDPLRELVRVEARQLGLGLEQGIVGRGALRRLIGDTLESCVAFVGADLNSTPLHLLRHLPGLDFEVAQKIVARREERPYTSLRELVDDGLLDEGRFRNAAGFLRVAEATNPLERTPLHPEQYDLARAIAERLGVSVDEAIGNRDLLRGLKRTGFEVEESTWRDLTRGLGSPTRDPRPRALIPRMLPPDTTPETLAKDQVVEGIVSSVASFGAFVDLGITRDGMIHISEASQRYVRDARAMLAVGQVVRARVTNPESPRVELSLKGVPDPRRTGGGPRRGDGQQGGRGRGRDKELWPEYQPVVRAARSRRDGMAGAGGGGRGGGRGRGGPGGGPGGGRGFGRRGPRRDQDEGFDRDAVRRAASEKISYNPFANFFQKNKPGKGEAEE